MMFIVTSVANLNAPNYIYNVTIYMAHSRLQHIHGVSINMTVTSVANVNAPNHVYNVTMGWLRSVGSIKL